MALQTDPNFGLSHTDDPGASNWNLWNDANLKRLGALLFLSVINLTTTAPPGSPAEGDRYIVGASATGAWVGKDGQVAVFAGGAWAYYVPRAGWLARSAADNLQYLFNGTAWVETPRTIAVRVKKTVAQSLAAGAYTTLSWNSEVYDTSAMHDNATNNSRLTCVVAGFYRIYGCVSYAAASGGTREAYITLNGGAAIVDAEFVNNSSGANTTIPLATEYYLNVGDYIELNGYQNTVGAVNVQIGSSHFGMSRI